MYIPQYQFKSSFWSKKTALPSPPGQTPPHPRGLQRLEDAEVEVVVPEPLVFEALPSRHPLGRLLDQQHGDEVFGLVRGLAQLGVLQGEVGVQHPRHRPEPVDGEEGGLAAGQELVGDAPDAPHVGGGRRVRAVHHLGRHVLDRPETVMSKINYRQFT